MSDIRANTISDAAGTGPIDLYKQSAAKAWVNFNGTTATIRDSLNVASLVDNATGDFRVNYSSSMANANYAVTFGGKGDSVRVFYTGGNGNWSDPTSTYTEFAAYQESITSVVDTPYHFGATHGDLA